MNMANWIQQYHQMDEQKRDAKFEKLERDGRLALALLALSFLALIIGCLQEFHFESQIGILHLDAQSMFIMAVSAGICAALGAVMWLRMEMQVRFLELLGELKKK